jgi:Sugar phosphate isomerases/epimerases
MEFGLFNCGYQRLSLERAFADAKNFGYNYIELWGGRPHAFAPDLKNGGLADVLALIDKYGVPVRVYTPEHNAYPYNYMLGSEAQRADSVRYLELAMDVGKALGASDTLISVGHGGDATYKALRARLTRTLRELAEYAEAIGHRLVLEPLTAFESNTCTTCAELCEVLEEVSSPALGGMCDVVAPFTQGEDPAEYPRLLGGRMRHLHLVDSDGVSETHLMPGDGVMDLKKVLSDIREAGYDGTCTLELVTNYIAEPSRAARLALERVRKFL